MLYGAGDRWVSMGHGGMTLIGAIRNSLLYSVGDWWVSMWHGRMTLIGAIRNSLLYGVCDIWVSMGHGGMTLTGAIRNILYKPASVTLFSPQIPKSLSRLALHLSGLLVKTVPAVWMD